MKKSADSGGWMHGATGIPGYRMYLYAVILCGFVSVALAIYQLPQMTLGYKWLLLVALTLITSSCTIQIPGTNSKISIGDTLFFTNLILYGTSAGILTAAVDALAASLRARNNSRRLEYSLFNVAAIAVSAHISGKIFYWAFGNTPLFARATPPISEILFPLAALGFTHYLCNSGSVAIIVALEKHKNIVEIWKESFLWTSITYFAGAAGAGCIALSFGCITPPMIAIAAPVLLAVYMTYKTYLDKVEQVRSLAYYDSLTRLPNRILFTERLNESLTRANGGKGSVALMFLDLDNFKRINDTYGHGVGDLLLRCVAERLSSTLRVSDRTVLGEVREKDVMIGRFGGDEFTVMLTGVEDPNQVSQIAQRILQAFSNPFALDGQEVSAAVSIGISLSPRDGADSDTLLKNADAAMFCAKDAGRNSFQFYSQSMNDMSLMKLSIENDLRKALSRDEFRLFYQPKVDAKTREITGAEALIRWQHPTRGLLPPGEFIAVAEETGLIRPMGEWVIRSVCRQMAAWQLAGLPAIPVAINLSGMQFRQQPLQQLIAGILEETAVSPSCLELEITESVIMQNEEEADEALRALRKLGCRISIDDFGTGYSSLNRLKRFTLDALKIDRSFITDLSTNPDDRAITKAIIAMARSLELKVIAEGVETEEQYQFLKSQGCDEIQGYLFGKPIPASEFALLLAPDAAGTVSAPAGLQPPESPSLSSVASPVRSRMYRANLRLVSHRPGHVPRAIANEQLRVVASTKV